VNAKLIAKQFFNAASRLDADIKSMPEQLKKSGSSLGFTVNDRRLADSSSMVVIKIPSVANENGLVVVNLIQLIVGNFENDVVRRKFFF
jgi:hypothetical protein